MNIADADTKILMATLVFVYNKLKIKRSCFNRKKKNVWPFYLKIQSIPNFNEIWNTLTMYYNYIHFYTYLHLIYMYTAHSEFIII